MNNQKGLVPLLIIIILAALVGGYLVYQNQTKPTSQPVPQTTPSPSDASPATGAGGTSGAPNGDAETTNWKVYTNTEYKYSFRYPPEWNVYEPALHRDFEAYQGTAKGDPGFITLSPPQGQYGDVLIDIIATEENIPGKIQQLKKTGNSVIAEIQIDNLRVYREVRNNNITWYIPFNDKGGGLYVDLVENQKGILTPLIGRIVSTFKFIE